MKHLIITLGAAFVLAVAGVGIASAQTTPPTTNPITVTQAAKKSSGVTVAQASEPAKKKKPKVVIHVGGISTFNVGSNDLPRPSYNVPGQFTGACSAGSCGATGEYAYVDPVTHLTYGANIYLGNWALNYAHSYINQNIGRVGTGKPGSPDVYQVMNDDYTNDASLSTHFGPVAFAAGWHERVRMCCGNHPNWSGLQQTMWHDIYLQEAMRFGPKSKYFGKWVGLTVQEQFFPHNNPAFASCNVGGSGLGACATGVGGVTTFVPYEYNKWHVQYTPNVDIPIGGKDSTFAVFGLYTNNLDYFLNAPIWYLYNEVDYGFIKKWPPYTTLTVTNSNLYQYHSGYPYDNADTINRNKLVLNLDVALPVLY